MNHANLQFTLLRNALCPGCLTPLTAFSFVFHRNVAVCPACRDHLLHRGIEDAIFVLEAQIDLNDRQYVRHLLFYVPRTRPVDPLQFQHPSTQYVERPACDPKWMAHV